MEVIRTDQVSNREGSVVSRQKTVEGARIEISSEIAVSSTDELLVGVVELATKVATAGTGRGIERSNVPGPRVSRGIRRPTFRKRGKPGVHRRGHLARQRRRASTLSVVETRDRGHELAESGDSCGFGFLKAPSPRRSRLTTTSPKRRLSLRENLSIP